MKPMSLLLMMTLLASCSQFPKGSRSIESEVSEYEVKSLKEIKNHAHLLLDIHPELGEKQRIELKKTLEESLDRQQELKDQESKIVQSLLNGSILNEESIPKENRSTEDLKKHLNKIYVEKSTNILSLIDHINSMLLKKEVDEKFTRDAKIFIRDFR